MSVHWITRPTAAAWQALAYVAEATAADPAAATSSASLAAAQHTWRQLVSLWQNNSPNSSTKLPLWPLVSELLATEITLDNDRSAAPLDAEQLRAKFRSCAAASGFSVDQTATVAGSLLHELALALQSAQLEKELQLRIRPLREQWEAFGPGLLYRVRKRSPAAGNPVVIAVPPWGNQGGGWPLLPCPTSDRYLTANTATDEKMGAAKTGAAKTDAAKTGAAPTDAIPTGAAPQVLIQAVLTNPHPAVPEVVRLAWLILVAEAWNSRSPEAWAVAGRRSPADLIPLVLEAAEWVELARADESTRELARCVWCQPPFPVYNPSS
ncbi:MAG: hypothetical protein ACKPEY_20830 [Planctomycetota bacterium]